MFGLPSCALTRRQIDSVDIVFRKMLRRIVGWTRYPSETWEETMSRMKQKVASALQVHPIENWSGQLFRRKFRLTCRMQRQRHGWPLRVARWQPQETHVAALRGVGRPACRWDDHLNAFARNHLGFENWLVAAEAPEWPQHEDAFVKFMCQ